MGGTVAAAASALGGLRVEVSLPTAAPAPDDRPAPPDERPTRSPERAVAPSRHRR